MRSSSTTPSPAPSTASTAGPIRLNHLMWLVVGVLFVALVAFSVGTAAGFFLGRWTAAAQEFPSAGLPSGIGEEGADAEERRLRPEDMAVFWEAMELLEQNFYGEMPPKRERVYGAIRGVIDTLDDPNTGFLTPEQAQSFMDSMEGNYEGIGATVEWDEDLKAVRIVEPFPDQPAWRAGLRRGDLIIAVDGEPVSEMGDLQVAISKIKGPKGSKVVLTILRPGMPESFDVVVVRDVIEIPITSTEMVGTDQDIAYIRLSRFSEGAGRKVRDAVEQLLEDDPRGLVFDLRGNPGGLLREAKLVASVFLEDQVVLIERFSDGREEIHRTEGRALLPEGIPMVVLVDEATASAAEIVAGALQDAGRAVLVGTKTFGKGSVQLPHRLSDGSLLRVTIARWFTPAGRSIDGQGLEPDIVVEPLAEGPEEVPDIQLERAIELLERGQ